MTTPDPDELIACHDCDLLQRAPALPSPGTVYCLRCGARLFRTTEYGLERCLALTIAAGILFVVANAFPIVIIEIQGQQVATTLFGAVSALHEQERPLVAALVLATTIVVPALELLAITWMLGPLWLGIVAPGFNLWFHWVQIARPWGMIEVFMLGVLVSLAKLAHVATVVPGLALWSFGVLILLLAAASSAFDARELWKRVGQMQ